MKTQFSWATPTGTHGEYADKQLANLQKRIWLIEFLRLGLVIGCQGAKLGLPSVDTIARYKKHLFFTGVNIAHKNIYFTLFAHLSYNMLASIVDFGRNFPFIL